MANAGGSSTTVEKERPAETQPAERVGYVLERLLDEVETTRDQLRQPLLEASPVATAPQGQLAPAVLSALFDEKIGGTIHLALGTGYPESGSKNRSAIHWDMIKDLRDGGAIYLDGKRIQENGKFLI